jgi:hypothetical protein
VPPLPYAAKLLSHALHWQHWVIFLIEAVLIGVLHPLGLYFPEWKERLDLLYPPFAAVLLITVVVGLVIAGYQLHSETEKENKKLEEQLKPRLEICSGTWKFGDRWRIRVRNLSKGPVQFSIRLEHTEPHIEYQVPALLQITGTPPPHRESIIPGDGEALVDVLIESFFETPSIGLLSAEHPSLAVPIPRVNYNILICAFPVSLGGGTARHKFRITLQGQGTLTLSDAGEPMNC